MDVELVVQTTLINGSIHDFKVPHYLTQSAFYSLKVNKQQQHEFVGELGFHIVRPVSNMTCAALMLIPHASHTSFKTRLSHFQSEIRIQAECTGDRQQVGLLFENAALYSELC